MSDMREFDDLASKFNKAVYEFLTTKEATVYRSVVSGYAEYLIRSTLPLTEVRTANAFAQAAYDTGMNDTIKKFIPETDFSSEQKKKLGLASQKHPFARLCLEK
jgi:hypothetical protein